MVEPQCAMDFQEELHLIEDRDAGVSGVIAIHSTALGPAAGGCRFWHYTGRAEMTIDACGSPAA